jgi:alpha-glucosidase
MVKKYSIGKPFPTEAVVKKVDNAEERLPYFVKTKDGEKLKLTYVMEHETIVYGLGENTHGINKRGFHYESFCADDPSHTEDKKSLYAAHNFLVVDDSNKFGIFVDCPQKVYFDVGYTDHSVLEIVLEKEDSEIYIIEEETLDCIVSIFRDLIGQSYIPPKWAFGYQQSRWGYNNEEDIRKVAKKYREKNLPIDAIYLDIDYMERFKDFTVDKEAFPDLEQLAKDMKEENIHLVPIIDAGVKIEEGYETYEEGIENNYFVTDKDGNPFVAAVWPGAVHFPDFFNPEARAWFGEKYKFLLDQGIEGFWNDMNEPAIFYSKDGIEKAFDKIEEYKGKDLGIYEFFGLKDAVLNISNSEEDYKAMYHNIDGEQVCHYGLHNIYGYNMTRGAAEAFDKLEDKRILLFSRASSIGMHRYGGIWTGDNASWWSHLLLNIKMMPSLNMCGFLYTGADTGGFGAHTTYDLLVRWMQFSIFTPLLRNHAALGTREQELYQFEDTKAFKNTLEFRYSFIPYLYSAYIHAAKESNMMFKPLSFVYENDDRAKTVEDQLIFSDAMMITPVHEQNAKGRYIYLPEEMLCVRINKEGIKQYAVIEKGHTYIQLDLEEFAFFIRKNHFIYLAKPANSVEEIDETVFDLIGYAGDEKEMACQVYADDGYKKDISIEESYTINLEKKRKDWKATCSNSEIKFDNIHIYS